MATAIVTKYLPPTSTRGARVAAQWAEDGSERLIVGVRGDMDYAQVHREGLGRFLDREQLRWPLETMIPAVVGDVTVWVHVSADAAEAALMAHAAAVRPSD